MTLVLVTGATGMIGTAVARRLISIGRPVRALVRDSSDARDLEAAGVDLARVAADGAIARSAFDGVEAVVHAAGALSTGAAFTRGDRVANALYQAVNVELTERLLTLARAAAVKRFVFVSSCAVYGAPTSDQPIDEASRLAPESDYGASKVAAEQRVAVARGAGLSTAIVRPCITTGGGDRHFSPAVAALARLPALPLPEGGRARIDIAHADDLAHLILLCLDSPAADGRIYNATSDRPMALRHIVEGLALRLGLRPRLIPIPHGATARLRPALAASLRLLAPAAAPLMGPIALGYLTHDAVFDMSRARAELGFSTQTTADSLLDALAAATRDRR